MDRPRQLLSPLIVGKNGIDPAIGTKLPDDFTHLGMYLDDSIFQLGFVSVHFLENRIEGLLGNLLCRIQNQSKGLF